MHILDENILESQRQLLRSWRLSVKQIGLDAGRKGMQDEEVIPFLRTQHRPTFFTRDLGFYERNVCHSRFCIVVLAVGQHEVAYFVRRVLAHPEFASHSQRAGKVIRASRGSLLVWRVSSEREVRLTWTR